MKYRFNSTFVELGYIKELLKEFNLPRIPVITDDTKFIDNCLYINDLNVYKYDAAGQRLIKVNNYYYNRPILNLTTKMDLTNSYYNTDLHEYLGEYLRFIRDYKRLNLMPLYNCFSNRVVFPKGYDEDYNYYAVPVKFGQVYTIGFDSAVPVEMYCTLWNNVFIEGVKNSKYIFAGKDNLQDQTKWSLPKQFETATKMQVPSCRLDKPFLYTTLKDFDATRFVHHLNDIKLIIKLPVSNKTSITVLEGDYLYNTTISENITTEIIHSTDTNGKDYLKTYPTNLSLFNANDNIKHPFADRLVEYLLDEAVTNMDRLDDNIKRVQEYLIHLRHTGPKILYGVWDERMNNTIYNISKDSVVNGKRYSKLKRLDTYKSILDSEGAPIPSELYFETTRNLIDNKKDLLMYMDKDVEELFLATGLNDKYTR